MSLRATLTTLSVFAALVATTATAQQPPATPAAPTGYGAPITLDQARKVVAAAAAEAKKNNWRMVFAVVDSGSNLVLLERTDGAQLGSIDVAQAKANTAVDFQRSTKSYQDNLAKGAENLRFLSMPGITAAQGGEVMIVDGKVIGAIGISGGTGEQDVQAALAGIAALK